jgi:hypothetical protein
VALHVPAGAPTLLIRRDAYERIGLTRSALDERLGLTADEFRVEGNLVVVGPLVGEEALTTLLDELESLGLSHYDDFYELPGGWPDWLRLFAASA